MIAKALLRENQQQEEIHKLLLLGAGQSGKSTLFKQMISIYGDGFPDEERAGYVAIIYGNIIGSMQILIEQTDAFASEDKGASISAKLQRDREEVENARHDDVVDEKLAAVIARLWADPAILATYARRSEFQLNESAAYYFDKIEDIGDSEYLPSEADLLRSRSRTTGVVQNNFTIDGNHFQMFDVGGQRSERKKWIHCFEEVSCVLFVVALSAYDQKLFEDNHTNRMVESLALFDQITNSRWFAKTSIVLFMNKRDLFAEKINKVPITVCPVFKDYEGPARNYDSTTDYIIETFLQANSTDKTIYPHLTCATDRGNVNAVFDSVKDTVMKRSLEAAGLTP